MEFQNVLDALARIPDIIREPSADLTAAVLLLAIITITLLIAIVGAFLYMLRTRPETARPIEHRIDAGEGARGESSAATVPESTRSRLTRTGFSTGVVLIVVAALWVVLGASSSDRIVCESCHADSPHVGAESIDPHLDVGCVGCHEGGGWFERATVNLPERVGHVLLGRFAPGEAAEYGSPISSRECWRCHDEALEGVVVNEGRGTSMSHAEPLDAGAECMDCHTLRGGAVSARTVGHDPCLRCHGVGDVAGECDVCHEGDPAHAIRADRAGEGALARRQVPEPACGGCHVETTCDACHGMRMPHTEAFKLIGHARHAAIDIWTNGGRTCRTCHYPGHQDCSLCHTGQFPSHALTWRYDHQKAVDTKRSCSCHLTRNLIEDPNRTFCDICHDPAYQVER